MLSRFTLKNTILGTKATSRYSGFELLIIDKSEIL